MLPLRSSARRVIMVAWMIAGPSEAKLFMARDPLMMKCSGLNHRIVMLARNNTHWVSGEVLFDGRVH